MKKLLLLGAVPFLVGCSDGGYGFGYNGGGSAGNYSGFSYMDTGGAGSYTCEGVIGSGSDPATYCATGEHPHLCECY